MKEFDEIRKEKRIQVNETGENGMNGWITIRGYVFGFVCSNGGGWDHVSVSGRTRCPSWEEMCQIKDMFFRKDECCVEYHPAEKDYINFHPYCLHIWRPRDTEIQTPPKIFV